MPLYFGSQLQPTLGGGDAAPQMVRLKDIDLTAADEALLANDVDLIPIDHPHANEEGVDVPAGNQSVTNKITALNLKKYVLNVADNAEETDFPIVFHNQGEQLLDNAGLIYNPYRRSMTIGSTNTQNTASLLINRTIDHTSTFGPTAQLYITGDTTATINATPGSTTAGLLCSPMMRTVSGGNHPNIITSAQFGMTLIPNNPTIAEASNINLNYQPTAAT